MVIVPLSSACRKVGHVDWTHTSRYGILCFLAVLQTICEPKLYLYLLQNSTWCLMSFCLPVWMLTIWLLVITLISVKRPFALSKSRESSALWIGQSRLVVEHWSDRRRGSVKFFSCAYVNKMKAAFNFYRTLSFSGKMLFCNTDMAKDVRERGNTRLTSWITRWVFGDKKGLTLCHTTCQGYPFNWNTVLRCIRSSYFALSELQLPEANSHLKDTCFWL